MPSNAERLARSQYAYVIAPAGCGKTELIAQAVAAQPNQRDLVLTHTHAGTSALRRRMRKYQVPARDVYVDTIAGFALRYAASYPEISGLPNFEPRGAEWNDVYGAALRVLDSHVGMEVVKSSFSSVYVDEYQDCSIAQHEIVMCLAAVLPVRLVGDPMQGIFDFTGPMVNWENDVDANFERLPDLTTPWRWEAKNPKLGEWLLHARQQLQDNQPVQMEGAPVTTATNDRASRIQTCHSAANQQGSVVALRKWANDAHAFAKVMGGRFTSMEEMECNDLQSYCRRIEKASSTDKAILLVEFAKLAMTGIGSRLQSCCRAITEGKLPRGRKTAENSAAINSLVSVVESQGAPEHMLNALTHIAGMSKVTLHRRELYACMKQSLELLADDSSQSLQEVAWQLRDRARHTERRVPRRIVSRTLLVKGLEFDHCVILEPSEFDSKNLYVAMTRGERSLTMLAADPNVAFSYAGVDEEKQ